MAEIEIKHLAGPELGPWLSDLARLRITVFRDFPYLYDGTIEYEEHYLQTYLKSADSIVVLALDGERVIGASTGLPLDHETEEFQRPFVEQGYDPATIFYCAESVLLPEYRGKGIYKSFFTGREDQARKLKRDWATFCCVQRPADHPLRPAEYVPLDAVWGKFGYVRHPELQTSYHWKDVDRLEETDKPMVFWLKDLREAGS
ncbi:GNAT family N-acetyltransferase [Methylococcus sp. EFPC2]|uniref:GNAT family N-acetyltransferase n=1 Tax=Methylococcus sp. EFPC2 TaxID=2812648 RepID=UPI0019683561|nr:GNAT family N-acetyltransferase [Methylococcus sp. EFPC2]QSA98039.1 GNAT family N-acetyltransferase [Methylococcus sp. EFPC2]